MSDAVIISIVTGIVTTVTGIFSLITLRMQLKTKSKVDVVEKKLDENHKQQNGNLTKLLKTTADLATANEKAKQEAIKK